MAGNNSIQILRGSSSYNPNNVELLDGQPFYSKKNKQLYVGDNTQEQLKPVGAANLIPGDGLDSVVQIYSGEVDDTHFGNTNTGESAAVFGEANNNSANRALLAGKLNNNSGANAIVGGLRNTVKATHGITIGSVNTVEGPAIRSVTAGYNNTNSGEDSIQTGTSNKNYGIGSAEFGSQNINRGHYSALIGSGLRNEQQKEDGTYNTKVIVGKWNLDRLDNIFEVGNGENDKKRSNAFEVLRDGRAKVKTAPKEDDDVVRKLELDGKISISDINQAFFNSLYN